MRTIAERYLADLEKSPTQLAEENQHLINTFKKFSKAIGYGVLSIILYVLLYEYSDTLINLAQETHAGHKSLFFVPIIVALVFSLVHGTFTSHFWDSLGVKAKKTK